MGLKGSEVERVNLRAEGPPPHWVSWGSPGGPGALGSRVSGGVPGCPGSGVPGSPCPRPLRVPLMGCTFKVAPALQSYGFEPWSLVA